MKTVNGQTIDPKLQQGLLKRLGMGGFLFFLIKGLLWLTLPAALTMAGLD